MELIDLYSEENRELLLIFSWFNKNSMFDKSGGRFAETDLFTFLQSAAKYDYYSDTRYDDVYFILQYVETTVLYLIEHINKEIRREHLILPISQAKEFDNKSIMWLSRQDGRTIREKIKGNKLKAVKRYHEIDTHENRVFKTLLNRLILIYDKRSDMDAYDYLFVKIRKWLRSEEASQIDEHKKIVYNNILLHHKHYSKIFKSYKWLNSLTDKINSVQKEQSGKLPLILMVDMLARLQFNSSLLIKPERLNIDHESFTMSLNLKEILLGQIDLMSVKLDRDRPLRFEDIPETSEALLKDQFGILLDKDRTFELEASVCKEAYVDLFRAYPVCRSNGMTQEFPITIKQKIGKQIICASNTKVIDLDCEMYTLPEILKTYNTDILKYFLNDLQSIFGESKFNYIIPDYVNVFEFSQVKKIIKSYFKNSRSAPKSVLAGLKYLFDESEGNVGDTLVYIQKDNNEDIFVTPLLIKYEESLGDVTRGLFLEKHPTRKIVSNREISDAVRKKFSDDIAGKLLNKFLQNGIRRIQDDRVALLYEDKIEYMECLDLSGEDFSERSLEDFKKLHTHQSLFRKKIIILNDNDAENLYHFEKMLELHKKGHTLWKEHLPSLAMEIIKSGYYDRFVLVDDKSEVRDNHIEIRKTFIIPANVNELSFPLIFNEENIPYKAYMGGKDFPYAEDVECVLDLKYDYEDETPYKLRFIPFDKSFTPINVKWIENRFDLSKHELIYPSFPPKKNWEEFKSDPKPNGTGTSDLLGWILERLQPLEDIYEAPKFIVDKHTKNKKEREEGYFVFGQNDKNGQYFCFVEVDGKRIFCHSKDFLEDINVKMLTEGTPVFLNIRKNKDRLQGEDITFSFKELQYEQIVKSVKEDYRRLPFDRKIEPIIKSIYSIKYPVYTVWNNHSLSDQDTPIFFRNEILKHINKAMKYLVDGELPVNFKQALFFFLSSLHKDMPVEIADLLIRYSKSVDELRKYSDNIATAIGDATESWQKALFDNILSFLDADERLKFTEIQAILGILSVAFWRAENLVFELNNYQIHKITLLLLEQIKTSFVHMQNDTRNIKVMAQKLELLLAMLRLREKHPYLIPKQENTLSFLEVVDEITQYFIINQILLKSRLKISVDKGDTFANTPDLLYALRVYLSGDNHNGKAIKIVGVNED
jgi:hypothetical protein